MTTEAKALPLPKLLTQKTRRGLTRKPRRFDQTYLSAEVHGHYVHRDYAAHFFRWGWVPRHLAGVDHHRVLDVGCGPEVPLCRLMTAQGRYPTRYVGVDYNEFEPKISIPGWATVLTGADFVALSLDLRQQIEEGLGADLGGKASVATCFEVIEHMSPEDGQRLLANIYDFLLPGGKLLLSTPVFDGAAAVNHVHEYTVVELQRLIEAAGFQVGARYGTFANVPALKKVMSPAELEVMESLSGYYSNDVFSCLFAPNYPDSSRNNVWEVYKPS
jgi:SAM-dependent methyltransferase